MNTWNPYFVDPSPQVLQPKNVDFSFAFSRLNCKYLQNITKV